MSISCDPNDLLQQAIPYQKITGTEVGSVIIYLLAQKAGLGALTADQLIDLAKCYQCKIPPGMFKAVEIALLCTATGGVPPCPGAGGGGGTCPQDMQVAWTPTNVKLGEELGFFTFGDIPGITSITFNQATSIAGFDIESTTQVTSVSFPNLISVDPLNSQGAGLYLVSNSALTSFSAPLLSVAHIFSIRGCNALASVSLPSLTSTPGQLDFESNTSLVSLSIPNWKPQNTDSVTVTGCALNAASVNLVLARCVANASFTNGNVDLSGGTNAAPSGQGIVDKATLTGRGVTVVTN